MSISTKRRCWDYYWNKKTRQGITLILRFYSWSSGARLKRRPANIKYLAGWFAVSAGTQVEAGVWKKEYLVWIPEEVKPNRKSREFKVAKMFYWVKTKKESSADTAVCAFSPQSGPRSLAPSFLPLQTLQEVHPVLKGVYCFLYLLPPANEERACVLEEARLPRKRLQQFTRTSKECKTKHGPRTRSSWTHIHRCTSCTVHVFDRLSVATHLSVFTAGIYLAPRTLQAHVHKTFHMGSDVVSQWPSSGSDRDP